MGLSFLIAAGLVAVPVIIHIFNRTRYRRVNWAAMEFLLAAYRKTRRRLQLEHLILLALRILAMIFLAFAFFPSDVESAARSAMNWAGISFSQATDSGLARHLVLVLDDTASMQFKDANRSSYERGVERAAALLSGLREGRDQVTLIRVSSVGMSRDASLNDDENLQRLNREIRASDPTRAAELLAKSRPGFGRGDVLAALREAGRRVESIDILREQPMVAVISDFQQQEWSFASTMDGNNKAFTDAVQSLQTRLAQVSQKVTFIDVGPRVAANYGVVSAELDSPIVGAGVPTRIRVKVGNFTSGTEQPNVIELRYRINQGEARAFSTKPIVAPGQTGMVVQDIPAFDKPGVHTIKVEITNKDLWDADNSRIIAINVIDSLPIAIVSESENLFSERSEAFFLYLALGITEGDGVKYTPNRVSVITPKSIEEASRRFNEYAVIVLADMAALSLPVIQRLEQYVSEGGGTVVFCLGGRVDLEKYNEFVYRDGAGLLPGKLKEVRGKEPNDPAAQLVSIGNVDLSSGSPLEGWGEKPADKLLLTSAEFLRQWVRVELPTAPGSSEDAKGASMAPTQPSLFATKVIASINAEGSDPLLVTKRFGRGHSVLWTSSIGNSWHYLWSADYAGIGLPLFHDIVRSMALGDRSRSNLEVGDHFVRNLLDTEQTALGNDVLTPDGANDRPVIRTLPEDRQQIVYSRTATPGLYRLRFLADVNGRTEAAREELFSVAIPAVESDVARLGGDPTTVASPQDALKRGLPGLEFEFESTGGEATVKETEGLANRFDVWLLLVGLAAFFLLTEIAMSVWIGRRAE